MSSFPLAKVLSSLNLTDDSKKVKALISHDPVICKAIQPWTKYTKDQYEQMIKDFLNDLAGSVYKHYYNYRHNNYSIQEAFQDAFEAIEICLEIDKRPPSLVEKGFKCPGCNVPVPDTIRDVDGRTDDQCASNVASRTFADTCACGRTWRKTITKAQFATLFFTQVRGKIQSTVRKTMQVFPSWDQLHASSGSLNEPSMTLSLKSSDETSEDMIFISKLIQRVTESIVEFTPRHAEIMNLSLYGKNSKGKPLQQSEIAKLLGVSKQRVCNIWKECLETMRGYFSPEEKVRFYRIFSER